ncbi:MAG: MerR family transcriptional regulator [Fibromonadaceae bacterium]|jgi:DNA-binding transcriptional MerR regulator|nr:MerR family transcriptional regulator [Fibromonadaceae bacterium]
MKYGQVETEKLYFSSSEAAKQIGVPVSVLHSWEKDFPALAPQKNANGKRIYRQSDIEIAMKIKEERVVEISVKKNYPANSLNSINSEPDKNFLLKIRNRLQNILDNIKDR